MTVDRSPAIKRNHHPAEDLPARPRKSAETVAPQPPPAAPVQERLTEQHNVRIRPSTKQRLTRAVDKLRFETGDRSISIASITDIAIDQYLAGKGC